MSLARTLSANPFILAEAAVIETLKRTPGIELDSELANSRLIYDETGRRLIAGLLHQFIALARTIEVPIMVTTPTWRANPDRLERARENRDINTDAVSFVRHLQAAWGAWGNANILVGGLMSCRHDCYRPEMGLTAAAAEDFHVWQARKLSAAGVDFLIAQTLPALPEALGLARALAATLSDYIISFVINRRGTLLDGTSLEKAIATLDAGVARPPLGYMINCAWLEFIDLAQPEIVTSRLVGFQANASSLDQAELDGARKLESDDLSAWGRAMVRLNRRLGVKILGGCCGTNVEHLAYLVARLAPRRGRSASYRKDI